MQELEQTEPRLVKIASKFKERDIAEQPTSPLIAGVLAQEAHQARTNPATLASVPVQKQEQMPPGRSSTRHPLHDLWRRRVPALLQMTHTECGAACLAMILSYYGRDTSIAEVRERCSPGRDGLSAFSLLQAAQSYGLRVRAVTLKEEDFRRVSLPAIVHWQFDHFLVVERWTGTHVDVIDPATGRQRLTIEEFDKGFTGIVMMFEPGVHFQRARTTSQVSLYAYIRNYLTLAPGSLVQIIIASLILQVFGLGVPLLTEVVLDQIIPFQLESVMMVLAIGMLVIVLSQLVILFLRSSLLIYLQSRVDTHLMLGFFEHLLSLPLSFFQQRASGDILARLNSHTTIRDILNNQLTSTLLDGSFVLVYLGLLLWQAPSFAALVLITGSLQVALLFLMRSLIRKLLRRELLTQGTAQSYVAEALAGIVTIKAAGAEQHALERWSSLFFKQLNVSIRRSYLSSTIEGLMTALRVLSPLALLWIGTQLVLQGQMKVGAMLALNALATSFLIPLGSLVSMGQRLQMVQPNLERIADVMKAAPEQDAQVQPAPRLSGQVQLKQVSFRYAENAPEVLLDVDITIEAGQKVALVGRTGSGKSTLGKLLLGLYLPTQGEISYDSLPLREMNYQQVRMQFGVVMQEATVFSGTIRQNITMLDSSMDLEHVAQSAQLADLHEDILRMPMGYETFISERGSALSGGQRQRLALARALSRSPSILLLDEATSSVDAVTERTIERNLEQLPCTQIIIAHRLSTIRHADLIVVLEQGRIVERGTHQDLMSRDGHYATLVRSQLNEM